MNDRDAKSELKRYLQAAREALVWKLDGLDERDIRMPGTATGTNLAGIVKHCANVEIGYFGLTFGRAWPESNDPCYVPLQAYDDDPQADWYLAADVATAELVDFYRRVWTFSDSTIDELPLDAVGEVPWWPNDRSVTLHHMLVRVIDDSSRHAGQADILREHMDGTAGLRADNTNMPDEVDWPAYVAKLEGIAEQFPAGDGAPA